MSAALPTPPATPVAATSAPTAAAPLPNVAAVAPVPNAAVAAATAPAPRRIAPLRRTNAFVNLRTLRAEPSPALTMPGAWPRAQKPDPIQAAVEATQKEIQLKRKRAEEDAARDEKRRRVESDAPAPSRAEARPTARDALTGATASTHQHLTATAATSAARKAPKLKATLSKCPPPPPLTSKAGPSTSSGTSTSASSASTSTSAQLRKTALLREAPTLINIPTIAAPSSVTTLSRQPAVMFGIAATAQPSMDPALVPGAGHMLAAGFLPAVSGSPPRRKRETPHSPPPPPRKKRRGKRSGHRSRKLDERHDTTEKEDKDRDGAPASA